MSDNVPISQQSPVPAPSAPAAPSRRRPPTVRNVCYTLILPEDTNEHPAWIAAAKELNATYHVFGIEVCPTTGRLHLQGYAEFSSQRSYRAIQSELGGPAHCEKRRGTPQQAATYCKKDGNVFETGTISQQGRRTDIEATLGAIRTNPRLRRREIAEQFTGVFARYPRFVDTVVGFYRTVQTLNWTDSPNRFIYGPAGSGKSRYARTLFSDDELYIKTHNKWFDGYDGESCVLIDDLHPDNAKYMVTNIKIWADRYPFRAELKGSVIRIRPQSVVITSNYSIEEMFPNPQDQAAIRRRFHVTHMDLSFFS